MCGRFTLKTPPRLIGEQFPAFKLSFTESIVDGWQPRYNIAPGQPLLVIYHGANPQEFEPALMEWGITPSWAKDGVNNKRLINARAETLSIKRSFRNAFSDRRCLILTDGYYEWKKSGNQKQPFYFSRTDGSPFLFAGLWESPTNKVADSPKNAGSCVIITTRPNRLAATIHTRMPAIMDEDTGYRWLAQDTNTLQALLAPAGETFLTAKLVSRFVNRVGNDSPACIESL